MANLLAWVGVGTGASRTLRIFSKLPNRALIDWFTIHLVACRMLPITMPVRTAPSRIAGVLLALMVPVAGWAEDDREMQSLREAVQAGRVVSLEDILADSLKRVPGRVVDVEVDLDDDEYEIEILDADGVIWELEYRASSGQLIEIERDD